MKTINELLQLLLIEMEKKENYSPPGLCIAVMWIPVSLSVKELEILHKYIKKHAKPNIFQKRYYCRKGMFYKDKDSAYYWPPFAKEPRIKWLKKHIKLTAPKS